MPGNLSRWLAVLQTTSILNAQDISSVCCLAVPLPARQYGYKRVFSVGVEICYPSRATRAKGVLLSVGVESCCPFGAGWPFCLYCTACSFCPAALLNVFLRLPWIRSMWAAALQHACKHEHASAELHALSAQCAQSLFTSLSCKCGVLLACATDGWRMVSECARCQPSPGSHATANCMVAAPFILAHCHWHTHTFYKSVCQTPS